MAPRRLDLVSNLIWPFLILLAAAFWLLNALGALPPVFIDLLKRGWPALLVLFGLMLLLGRRFRFGNLLAVATSILLIGGVVTVAYNQQSGKMREDYVEPVAYTLGPEVTSIQATLNLLQTAIEIRPANAGERTITGKFTGSLESLVTSDFRVSADGLATFTLREAQRNAVPLLEQVGKGKLTLFVPSGIAISQLIITGREGDLTLDASSASIKRLSVTLDAGNMNVSLANESGLIGDLKTGRGDVTVAIPPQLAAQITLRGSGADSPQFSGEVYTLRIDKVLVPKRAADPQMQLTIDAAGSATIK
jgi:hypothetical protein